MFNGKRFDIAFMSLAQVASLFLPFLLYSQLSDRLSEKQFASFLFSQAVFSFIATVSEFGSSNYGINELNNQKYSSINDKAKVISGIMSSRIILGLICILFYVSFVFVTGNTFNIIIFIAILSGIFQSLALNWAFLSLGKVRMSLTIELILRFVFIIACLILADVFGISDVTIYGAVLLITVISAFLIEILIIRKMGIRIYLAFDTGKVYIKNSFSYFLSNNLNIFLLMIVNIILNTRLIPDVYSSYAIVERIARASMSLILPINQFLLSKNNSSNHQGLSLRIFVGAVVSILLSVVFASHFFIPLIFPNDSGAISRYLVLTLPWIAGVCASNYLMTQFVIKYELGYNFAVCSSVSYSICLLALLINPTFNVTEVLFLLAGSEILVICATCYTIRRIKRGE